MLKLKNKKSKKNNSGFVDSYDFSYLRARREVKEAANLPDLPNLSKLRSANRDRLPDLHGWERNVKDEKNELDAKDERKTMKRRSRIIKNNLKQLKRYYAEHSVSGYASATIDDYDSVLNDANDTEIPLQNNKNKLRSKDMMRKYSHLKFQAWSLILIIIVLTIGLAASLGNARVFFHKEYAPAIARKEKTLKTVATVEYDAETDKNAVGKYNIRYINQITEGLPNGCEAVSLAMALSRFIPDITPQEIVEKYLPRAALSVYNGVYISEDPTNYYIGDPAGRGFGIFADGLTRAAQNALRAYDIDREVINISGCTDEELFKYIDDGHPVIVWSTMELKPVEWGAWSWHLPTGKIYRYPGNQHCCVLVEYNQRSVVLYDPTNGTVTYGRTAFLDRWNEIGPYADVTRQAIVIR